MFWGLGLVGLSRFSVCKALIFEGPGFKSFGHQRAGNLASNYATTQGTMNTGIRELERLAPRLTYATTSRNPKYPHIGSVEPLW